MALLVCTYDTTLNNVTGGMRMRGGLLTGAAAAGHIQTGLKKVFHALVVNQTGAETSSPCVIRNSNEGTEGTAPGSIHVEAVEDKVYRWVAWGW
jgi:hypothetical protein